MPPTTLRDGRPEARGADGRRGEEPDRWNRGRRPDLLVDAVEVWEQAAGVAASHEKDALKYALKACFLERMAEVWSEPPKSHPAQAPDWCQRIPAVQKEFSVIPEEYRDFYEGDLVSPIFSKRNIFAPRDFMFFV